MEKPTIKQQFISTNRKNQRPNLPNSKKSVTIHSTGNPSSTAQNEADYVCFNSTRQAGFHFVVDEKQIIQVCPINEGVYHCGKAEGNQSSISIELCESGDRKKVFDNGVKLAAWLMYSEGINILKTHNDWNGKNCPRILLDSIQIRNGLNWFSFQTEVSKLLHTYEKEKVIFNTLEEVPKDFQASVKWAIDKGILKGDGNGLGLTRENIRALVFLHRYAQLDI